MKHFAKYYLPTNAQWFHFSITLTFFAAAVDQSTYNLSVECGKSGLYQVLYKDRNDNDGSNCVYSCQFLIEVVEVREEVLRDEFSVYRE